MSDQKQAKKPSGCRMGCLGLLAFGGLVAVLVVAAVAVVTMGAFGEFRAGMSGWRQARQTEWGVDERPELIEIWSSGSGEVKVARILIRGVILLEGPGFFMEGGSASAALRAIKRASADPEVRGIILDIDSGGGGITASDILYQALLDFKSQSEGRVVVAQFGDIAASGAYYIALAADRIVAHPTTLTGSIGVIMQSYNIRELAAKLGIADVTIKSGENKDLLNPFRELSSEQEQMLQGVVDALHNRFVALTAERRGLDEQAVRAVADGRVLLAEQALEKQLIDQIGYADDVARLTAELLATDAVHVVRYEEPTGLFDLFRHRSRFGFSLRGLFGDRQTRLLYQSGL